MYEALPCTVNSNMALPHLWYKSFVAVSLKTQSPRPFTIEPGICRLTFLISAAGTPMLDCLCLCKVGDALSIRKPIRDRKILDPDGIVCCSCIRKMSKVMDLPRSREWIWLLFPDCRDGYTC